MSEVSSWKIEDINPDNWSTDSYSAEDLEYDFQSTLDSWRSYEITKNAIEELDEELKEEYGAGVDFAAIYGSTSQGLSILSDAILPRSHEPGDKYFDDSDIDVIVGLERPEQGVDEKAYRRSAANSLYEGHDDISEHPESKLHPLVEMSDGLTEILSEARKDWLEDGGSPNQRISLKAQTKGDGVYKVNRYWHDLMRCMAEGTAFSEEFWNDRFYNEVMKGKEIITENGEFRSDIDFDSSGLEHYESEPNRPDRLNRNFIYGLWERAKRNAEIGIPPENSYDDFNEKREVRRKHKGEWPGKILGHGVVEAEFDDKELASFFTEPIKTNKSDWAQELKEKDPDQYERRIEEVQNAFESHMDEIREFIPDQMKEDPKLSRHFVEDPKSFEDIGQFVGRTGRKDMPLEFYIVGDFAVHRIKSKYRELDKTHELDKQMHEYTLEELNKIEESNQTRFGEDW